jgi:uncharacterized protein YjbI with pentapeptide repeats
MDGPNGHLCTYEVEGENACKEKSSPDSESGYCILHERDQFKNTLLFAERIEKKLERKDYNFRGVYFPRQMSNLFREIVFEKKADFSNAVFTCKCDFQGAVFVRGATFIQTEFREDTNFQLSEFLANAYFTNSIFLKGVKFSNVEFKLRSQFGGTRFIGKVDFSDSNFLGHVDFVGANFINEAKFEGTTFNKATDFMGAEFKEDARFEGSRFIEGANFWKTKFYGATSFNGAEFAGGANFESASFFATVRFEDIEVSREMILKKAVFRSDTLLIPKTCVDMNLHESRFLSNTRIRLNGSNSRFAYADLSLVDFLDSRWPDDFIIIEERICDQRKRIRESNDNSFENSLDIFVVEATYRNLKKCMEKTGDYEKSGYFYYRERECRRKRSHGTKRLWLEIYKLLCGYGEKPVNVIRASIMIIFVFCLAYAFCQGISFSDQSFVVRLWESLYFSVITFTTLGYGDFHPVTYVGQLLAITEAFIGAFMIAVFVLVFGRKMMR